MFIKREERGKIGAKKAVQGWGCQVERERDKEIDKERAPWALNCLYGVSLPGSLWPIILLCLPLYPYLA